MKKNLPYVELGLQVKGAERQNKEILVDTGSSDSIDNDLIAQSTAPRLTAIGGVGLGQEFHIQLGHYESVQLGKLSFKNVAGASGASLMGGEFLHRFTTIFNYQKNQLIFEPNRHVEDVYLFNASGLDIKDSKDGVEITGILKGFPAETAGFQEGDVITAIDGLPVSNFRLQHLLQILHEGGQYYFTTNRKGMVQTRKLMIPPAPQIPW
jgi:membrane-associated protease RseP (regulator of RpoE activity)